MSQGRESRSPWRAILAEVNAQQTLLESLLYPHHNASGQNNTSLLAEAPVSSSSRTTGGPAAQSHEQSSLLRSSAVHLSLLSPSVDEAEPDVVARESHPARLLTVPAESRRGSVASRRSAAGEGSTSKVVEALVEALSTSSWSSEGEASSHSLAEHSSRARPAEAGTEQPAPRHASPSPHAPRDDHLVDAVASQSAALRTAGFFASATCIAASEFESRQRIMFNEFSAITELISLFVCRMSRTSISK